ncbi:globin domain-containing protein [Pseudonocardia sp. NPDC049154]|uniref:globin domain-containing protein n=1 Tax=Pseudonocardia sp. NPDC049154 TaxID=3155501 RepID=UPI0033F07B38
MGSPTGSGPIRARTDTGASDGRPTPEVMAAVQRSCRAVADRPERLAEVFYAHLFEMAPWARSMFAVDMTEQMQKMTATLLAAIEQLTTSDTADLEVLLHRMGAEHYVRYGVEPKHYLYIAHALTRAVRDVAGWEYSGHLSSCWVWLSEWVCRHMIAGAREAIAEQDPVEDDAGWRLSERATAAAIPSPRAAPVARDQPRHARRLFRTRG